MGKKKATEQAVTISLSEILDKAPDRIQLPSGPTHGIYEKNLRDSPGSNKDRLFYKNYARESHRDFVNRSTTQYKPVSTRFRSQNRDSEFEFKRQSWTPKVSLQDGASDETQGSKLLKDSKRDFSSLPFKTKEETKTEPSNRMPIFGRGYSSLRSQLGSDEKKSKPDFDLEKLKNKSVSLPLYSLEKPSFAERRQSEWKHGGKSSFLNKQQVNNGTRKVDIFGNHVKIKSPDDNEKITEKSKLNETIKDGDEMKFNKNAKSDVKVIEKKPITTFLKKEMKEEKPFKEMETNKINENVIKKNFTDTKTSQDVKSKEENETIKTGEGKAIPKKGADKITLEEMVKKSKEWSVKKQNEKKEKEKEKKIQTTTQETKKDLEESRDIGTMLAQKAKSRVREKEDILSVLKEKQIRSEKKKREEELKAKNVQLEEEKKKELRELENMLAMKRNEGVEFFGNFKHSNKMVDLLLWKRGLEHFLSIKESGLENEFKKLTVWCLKENIASIKNLNEELNKNLLVSAKEEKARENLQRKKAFIADVFAIFVENFGEKYLLSKMKREGIELKTLFGFKQEDELFEFLENNKLNYLKPKESLAKKLAIRLEEVQYKKLKCSNDILDYLENECSREDIKSEPEISQPIAEVIFHDYFSSLPINVQNMAAVRTATHSIFPGDVTEANANDSSQDIGQAKIEKATVNTTLDIKKRGVEGKEKISQKLYDKRRQNKEDDSGENESDDEKEITKFSVTIDPKVAEFFAPHLSLLRFLYEASLKHQRDLLNVLSSEWMKAGSNHLSAEALFRAITHMAIVDYDGICEWRYSVPSEEFKDAKRNILFATVNFLDGELEVEQRRRRKEEDEWKEELDSEEGDSNELFIE